MNWVVIYHGRMLAGYWLDVNPSYVVKYAGMIEGQSSNVLTVVYVEVYVNGSYGRYRSLSHRYNNIAQYII